MSTNTVTHSTCCAVGEECLQTTQDLQHDTNNESHTVVDSTVDMDTNDHVSGDDDGDGDKVSDDISVQRPGRGIVLKYI